MARLDRLSTAKGMAQLGAILGRVCAYEVLQVVSTLDDIALQQALAQCEGSRRPLGRYVNGADSGNAGAS